MKRQKGFPSFPNSRSTYVRLTSIILLEAVSIVAQAVFLARAITFLFQGMSFYEVGKEVILFLLAFIVRHALGKREGIVAERFATRVGRNLRNKLVDAYFLLGQRFVQLNGTGRLVTLSLEGIEQIKTYIETTIPRLLRTVIIPAVVVMYVFTLDTASAIILIVTVPIIVIFMILLGLAAEKMADKQYDTYRVLSNHFVDTLKGIDTLTYLGQSEQHDKKIARVSERYRKATIRTLRVAFLSSFALDFFTSLSIAFVAVGLGFRLIDGSLLLWPALTILLLAPEYFLPIKQVGSDYHATLDGQVALEQVEGIIAEQKKAVDMIAERRAIHWDSSSSIKFYDVTAFSETLDKPLLKELSFSWQGYGTIGIVGKSGAGKSTLIDVLAGFLQHNEGFIEINGDRQQLYSNANWQQLVAYIPQSPYLFPASLADNIRFYERDATDEEVNNVIDDIGLRSFVDQLPNGMYETVGEGGRSVSGGQEQRIAIARALLSNKPIVLLDEPTAHLDIETEFEIKQSMQKLFKNKLVFIATHRLHWVNEMDYILMLEDGQLVESGPHEELMLKQGAYHRFVKTYTGGESE
ncbi:thiol reductant ABC exporter subunit CydD [Pueribacillus sp. YX66]|uniref:thiol reductant ABC exporter subunit CydD n=1 Tax=Pueribacillus sp. YX66 TaxID=3229242 RepID=UPI00358D53BE